MVDITVLQYIKKMLYLFLIDLIAYLNSIQVLFSQLALYVDEFCFNVNGLSWQIPNFHILV
jgi:hypothetical protein